ncbi:hypothetical protein AB2J17_16840 [Citrobacter freundii]|uniref:hypothetical protein n=1 Tax=Citrobacter freundii TaxID=546 RepID=UPI0034A23750
MEELRNMRTGALSKEERRKKKEERRKKKEERRKKKEERRKKKEDAYVTILLISNISPTGYCGKANHCISCIT